MIFDRALCYVLAALLFIGALLTTDAFTRAVSLAGALACAVIARVRLADGGVAVISDDLRGRIHRAARELPLPPIDRRVIDCRLSDEDWRGLVFELRTIATRPGCAPLAALADDVQREVRS